MNEITRILIVDDDKSIRHMVKATFSEKAFIIFEAENASNGIALVQQYLPELIILDLGLPDFDGLEFISRLRTWSTVPVIVLSARGEEAAKIKALDEGANDFVTKPFSPGELQARCRAALRSAATKSDDIKELRVGNIFIDFASMQVTRNENIVHLTPVELKLLLTLARKAGRVLTHKQLLVEVWGFSHIEQTHYLRIFMKRLREKLEEDPSKPKFILTESGIGYRMQAE